MGRVFATILASFLVCAEVSPQEFADSKETAYVIEIGMVSYDRHLPTSVIRAFQEELEDRGELESRDNGDVEDLAYKQKAVESGRIALTFVLNVGDQSTQRITTTDSSIMAQVRVLSADDDSVTASTTSQFSGKIVSRNGGGSGGSSSQGRKIPLDDKEHHTGGGGSFVYFPNGGGQGHAQRQYVRARVAKPEDFEKQKLDPQLPLKLLARGQANAPRFLVLDERWSCLRLVAPAEYDGYSTLDKFGDLLRVKMEQETTRVKRICNLDEVQAEKLEVALLRHRVRVQKEALALEEAALRSPRSASYRTRLKMCRISIS